MNRPWEADPQGQAAVATDRIAGSLPRIALARVTLRAPYISDFEDYAKIVCTERGQYVDGPMSRDDAWLDFNQLVAGWLLRGAGLWTVVRNDDMKTLGFVMLDHEFGDPEPELGFLFLEEFEGQGYALEAARSARNNAYNALSWETLVSYIHPDNARAIKLAERLGAERDESADFGGCIAYRYPREIPE
ncbi:GNAT family N-acetyltransferase [Marivivens aquimaris]|uniref:GNAT family N-acetyltransferase n=1 Tax=Marivivens aquimaris TaxID=2774876 RepID=UPI00188291E3|nr:GNAT family N-acetyltransferase [Marivivens aquimaris]